MGNPRSQALPGDADPEALPPISRSLFEPKTLGNFTIAFRGRASGHRFPGRAWEPAMPDAQCPIPN
ncbi:hypothetical protein QT970_12370 [Microcoleus sp. herbarium8]|uniref:hypothetical protein n=1 Tax=Microcoleus sp. herbarium8 TaxID=3055436 RepID=UPI002FD5F2D3